MVSARKLEEYSLSFGAAVFFGLQKYRRYKLKSVGVPIFGGFLTDGSQCFELVVVVLLDFFNNVDVLLQKLVFTGQICEGLLQGDIIGVRSQHYQ